MAGLSILSPGPWHIISYSTLLGTTVFHTFVGGIISVQNMPRPQFGSLMAKIFPAYFAMQTALPVIMALTYPSGTWSGPGGIVGVLHANHWQALTPLTTMFFTGLLNLVLVGPKTTDCMMERRVQEKKDGKKSYDAPPHSTEMELLNKKFSLLHGISSALNVGSLVACIAYACTLASRLV